MALVRCTCLVALVDEGAGRNQLHVHVVDPHCDYIVHRLGSDLSPGQAPNGVRH